jgi:hypothetical protein
VEQKNNKVIIKIDRNRIRRMHHRLRNNLANPTFQEILEWLTIGHFTKAYDNVLQIPGVTHSGMKAFYAVEQKGDNECNPYYILATSPEFYEHVKDFPSYMVPFTVRTFNTEAVLEYFTFACQMDQANVIWDPVNKQASGHTFSQQNSAIFNMSFPRMPKSESPELKQKKTHTPDSSLKSPDSTKSPDGGKDGDETKDTKEPDKEDTGENKQTDGKEEGNKTDTGTTANGKTPPDNGNNQGAHDTNTDIHPSQVPLPPSPSREGT